MTSRTTPQFWEHYARLPTEIQQLADKGYKLWLANQGHPSIRFKPIRGKTNVYSARVGVHYRALAYREADLVVWVWIGHHSEYDALIAGK